MTASPNDSSPVEATDARTAVMSLARRLARRHRFLVVAFLLALGLSFYGHVTLTVPLGLFHDDGIYAATAKSLAEGHGYRIPSVPGFPAQTKYPILYPLLIAGVWKLAPTFPDNVDALRLVSALATVCFLVGSAHLHRELTGEESLLSMSAFLAALGLNPLVTNLGAMVLSDMLFAALCVAMWVVHVRWEGGSHRWSMVVGSSCLSACAMGTRVPGAAFLVAGSLWAARTGWRQFLTYVGIAGTLVLASRLAVPSSTAIDNPLLSYYTGYETSVFLDLLREPLRAVQIAADNCVYAVVMVGELMMPVPWRVVSWMLAALVVIGIVPTGRRAGRTVGASLVLYMLIVLFYPFIPTRYLLPLAPLLLIAGFNGATTIASRARGSRSTMSSDIVKAMAFAPLAVLLLTSFAWARWNLDQSRLPRLRLWTGGAATYQWTGFQDTFDWINGHTDKDAVMAGAFDPMYYLYTGRRGVRPWIPMPDTYFYPMRDRHPYVGDARRIREALDAVKATYLVVDPLDGFAEQPAVATLYPQLLREYGSRATLAFESGDGLHRVYRLSPPPK